MGADADVRAKFVRSVMGDVADGEMTPTQEGRRRKLEEAFDSVLPDLRVAVAGELAEDLRDCTMNSSRDYAEGWMAAADRIEKRAGWWA